LVSRKKHVSTALKGLGIKYGSTVRKRYGKAFRLLKHKRRCTSCGSWKFSRIASGIWYCAKCKFKVAGGAYDIDLQKL
jgi:large subunit ribosomal protein L37Ae